MKTDNFIPELPNHGLLDTSSISSENFEHCAFIVVGPSGSGKSTLLRKLTEIDKTVINLPNLTTRERRVSDCSTQIEFTSKEKFFGALRHGELFYARKKDNFYRQEYFVGYKKSEIHKALESSSPLGMTSHANFACLMIQTMKRIPIIMLTATPTIAVSRILERENKSTLFEYNSKQEAINKIVVCNETLKKLEQLVKMVGGSIIKLDTEKFRVNEYTSLAHTFVKEKIAKNRQTS